MDADQALAEVAAGQFRPFYLIYGDEPFLMEELLLAMRERLVPPGTEAFNFHRFEPGPAQVREAVQVARTLPFLAGRRLVLVTDCPLFGSGRSGRGEGESGAEPEAGGNDAEILAAYLEQPTLHTVMVVTAGAAVDSRRKLTRLAMQKGGVVECRALSPEAAAQWARDRAGRLGKNLSPEAAWLLVEKVGTDLRLLLSEVEKLALYVGEAPAITPADVAAAVTGTAEVVIWNLVDAAAEGRTGAAIACLDQMLRAGEPAPLLLWHLSRHFRLLVQARALAAKGVTAQQAAARARQSPGYWSKLMRQAGRYPRERLLAIMDRLLAADLALKSGHDPRLTLETLVADLGTA